MSKGYLAVPAVLAGPFLCSCGSGHTTEQGADGGGLVDGSLVRGEKGETGSVGDSPNDASGEVASDLGTPDGAISGDATFDAFAQIATTDGGSTVCVSLGWCQLMNTKLADVCPSPNQYPAIQAIEGCSAVVSDWSGAVADQTRDRLLIWGGGHGGYYGNELYALDLNRATMVRENDPARQLPGC